MSERTQVGRRAVAIAGGRVVTPGGVVPGGSVVVRGSQIAAVRSGPTASADERIDASGRLVLPGLVDLHGDDVETHLEPRTGAGVEPAVALVVSDRLNLAAGVTTKLNAVAFEESPSDNRSVRRANELLDAIDRSGRLLADHRVHARCAVTDPAAVDAVVDVIDHPAVDLVSLMRHVPGSGQFADQDAFEREYVADGDWSAAEARRLAGDRRAVDPRTLDDHVDRVVDRARAAGVPVASHDDEDADTVERLSERGVRISEYPTTLPAARRASDLGLVVAMGAPNLVRGGSLWGNLGAREAIESGVVDVLCSDYHPPSLLEAVFADTGEPLPEKVARVTAAPAAAAGLDDRGRLEPGRRADVVVVEPGPPPVVERAFVAGVEVYRAGSPGAGRGGTGRPDPVEVRDPDERPAG